MSLVAVRTLVRSRLNQLGYKEHSDAFDDTNRPQKQLDRLYRIVSGPVTGEAADSLTHTFTYSFDLHITVRGVGADNVAAVDRAFLLSEEVLGDLLQTTVRTGTDIKDLIPTSMTVEPYSASDDNDVLLVIGFDAIIYCEF